MTNFQDVTLLSAYLDGQLKASEVARLEARLKTDPELAAVLQDLHRTRGVLRQLPQRRAPRNFTLTPKMVGQKPPMPRAYPVFSYATVLATLLLFFTFATNFMAPRIVPTNLTGPYGIGGGSGGGCGNDDGCGEPELALEAAPAEEAMEAAEPAMPAAEVPMAPEAPAEAEAADSAMKEPTAEEPPAPATAPPEGTGLTTADEGARVEPTAQPSEKSGVQIVPTGETYAQGNAPAEAPPAQPASRPIGAAWQIILAGIAVLSALIAFIIRAFTVRSWRAKAK